MPDMNRYALDEWIDRYYSLVWLKYVLVLSLPVFFVIYALFSFADMYFVENIEIDEKVRIWLSSHDAQVRMYPKLCIAFMVFVGFCSVFSNNPWYFVVTLILCAMGLAWILSEYEYINMLLFEANFRYPETVYVNKSFVYISVSMMAV
ncbi:MAG: hypothetical protein AAFY02_17655, partial [Pseudomonadota bacterium]